MGQCSLAPFLTRFLRNVPGLKISCLGLAAWAKLKRYAPVPHTVCVSELGSAATLTCQLLISVGRVGWEPVASDVDLVFAELDCLSSTLSRLEVAGLAACSASRL